MRRPIKTYKREVALIAVGVMYVFIGYTLYTLGKLNQTQPMVELVGMLIIPTFATLAAAFGIDSYFKQNPKTGNLNQTEKREDGQ